MSVPEPRIAEPRTAEPRTACVRLGKYHGLGNDFLVIDGSGGGLAALVGPGDMAGPAVLVELAPEAVAALCNRRTGVGADGLIVCLAAQAAPAGAEQPAPAGAELAMVLYNADGSRAEMSGNGIRCLALFALDSGLVTSADFTVSTDGGDRRVQVRAERAPGLATVRVDMGRAVVADDEDEIVDVASGAVWRGRMVDVGNPHQVLFADDLEGLDLPRLGPAIEATRPGGVNVEWVRAVPGTDKLELRVWERGAGMTLACGTGSVAAVVAARAMGLVSGTRVSVHNPGGTLEVELSDDTAWLSGPTQRVAWVEVEAGLLGRHR